MNTPNGRRKEIILIGPCGCGKSTMGRLLAGKLNVPSVSMDDLCQGYYAEAPKGIAPQRGVQPSPRFPKGWIEGRWKDLYAIERLLTDHHNCVFDLGAGHSIYEDNDLLLRAQNILLPFDNVVLLMPSPDSAESIRILRERTLKTKNWDCIVEGFDFHEHFVGHHSNFNLAKYRVYTRGKSPAQTCDEIIDLARTGGEQSAGGNAAQPHASA